MTVKERLEQDIKASLKEGNKQRLNCLRMLKARLQEREVALRTTPKAEDGLTDDEAVAVIGAYAKQRRDSIESFQQASRDDLAQKEQEELAIVQEYLPQQLSEDQLRAMISGAIGESGATSVKDLGRVMKIVVPKTKGVADGKLVNRLVRELLAAAAE